MQALLDEEGFAGPRLRLGEPRNRQHSTAYPATLRHDLGHADLEVFVYDLTEDPAGLVDAEEERIALTQLDSELVPELLSYRSGPDLVILAVAYAEDAQRLRSSLGQSDDEAALVYQPDVDRLLGADGFRDMAGRLVLDCLMSRRRAEALMDILGRLVESTGADQENPCVPRMLAAYEVDSPSPIHSHGDLPEEYATLVVLTTLVSPYLPLDRQEHPLDSEEAGRLAARLLTTVRAGHRLPATFCRAGGCSLRPEFVLPTGDLADVYFLTAGEEYDAATLAELQVRDLLNAVETLATLDQSDDTLAAMLSVGIDAYTGTAVVPPLSEMVEAVAARRTLEAMGVLATFAYRLSARRGRGADSS